MRTAIRPPRRRRTWTAAAGAPGAAIVLAAVLAAGGAAMSGCGSGAAADGRPVAAFLGDSITKGAGDGGWYSGLVDGADPVLEHAGTIAENGMTTQWMRSQAPAALASRPDVLVVLGGTNDVSMGIPAERTVANLAAIADIAAAGGTRLAIATIPPFDDPDRAAAALALNERIRALAADRDLVLLDTAAAVAGPTGGWAAAELTTDGVHPTAEGSRRMAAAAAAALADLG